MTGDMPQEANVRVVTTPLPSSVSAGNRDAAVHNRRAAGVSSKVSDPYLRAENEDDDGYDPYSDRPAAPEPLFERDPWA